MVPICPECKTGKHQNCDGVADISINGADIACGCVEAEHPRRPEHLQNNFHG